MEHRDKMSQELWCRVYAKVVCKYLESLEGRNEAIRMANKAVEDFNNKYPYEGYADFGPR